jgi:hypothetical protein
VLFSLLLKRSSATAALGTVAPGYPSDPKILGLVGRRQHRAERSGAGLGVWSGGLGFDDGGLAVADDDRLAGTAWSWVARLRARRSRLMRDS